MGLHAVAFMRWLSWGGVLVGCDMGLDVDYWHESMGPEFGSDLPIPVGFC